jgi:aryl-alcohol dehydrogenase-like predicted oxidoreductase
MRHHPLGSTGLQVSEISFGTGSLGDMYGRLDDGDAIRLVHEVLDVGITFIDTSPYYGSAEERLGRALDGRRDEVLIGTKAGRYGLDDFDFSPARIRRSLDESLRRLRTDHVDVLQLHDVEFVPLGPVLDDAFEALAELRASGKARCVGMTGYPVPTLSRVIEETDVDVVLTYAKSTLLDDSLMDLVPLAERHGVGLINAAAVAIGLLTPGGSRATIGDPWPAAVAQAADRMRVLASDVGVDIAFLANQYSIQRTPAPTTVVGVGTSRHLHEALRAADTPIDEELLARFLALRPPSRERRWTMGLPENNRPEPRPAATAAR